MLTLTVLLGNGWSCGVLPTEVAASVARKDLPRDGQPLLTVANKSRTSVSFSLQVRNGSGEERISHLLFVGTEYQTTRTKSASEVTVNLLGDSNWRAQFTADSFLIVVEASNHNSRSLPVPIPRLVEIPVPPKHLDDPNIKEVRIEIHEDHAILAYAGTKKRFAFLEYDKKHPVFHKS